MKTNLKLVPASLLFLVLLSCHKEKDILPANARLKQVLQYGTIDSKEPMGIEEEYEYNNLGQISKVSYRDSFISGFSRYDLYEYNSIGQLIKINHYDSNSNSPTGYELGIIYTYTYSIDGKKIKETIAYRYGGSEYVAELNKFFYTEGRLSRIENYDTGSLGEMLQVYTIIEFDENNQPVREVLYLGYTNTPLTWTINTFSNGLNVKTVIYSHIEGYIEDPDYIIREFIRTFDVNGNLKILETVQGNLSGQFGNFVYKYIYFGE